MKKKDYFLTLGSYAGEGVGCLGTAVTASYAMAGIIESNSYPSLQSCLFGFSLAIATVYFSSLRQVIHSKSRVEEKILHLEENQRRLEEIVLS